MQTVSVFNKIHPTMVTVNTGSRKWKLKPENGNGRQLPKLVWVVRLCKPLPAFQHCTREVGGPGDKAIL